MNEKLFKILKEVVGSKAFQEAAKGAGLAVSKFVINKAEEKIKDINQKRKENMENGMNSDQAFNNAKKEYEEVFEDHKEEFEKENFNWEDIAKNIFKNVFSKLEGNFDFNYKNLFSYFKEYKSYLEGNITDEEEVILINKLYLLVDKFTGDNGLEKMIGEEAYKELLTLIIKHSMKVSNVIYNYGKNKINERQMKEKLKTLYETYALTVLNFVKNNSFVKEQSLSILRQAFGAKNAVILGIVMTVAINVFDGEKREEVAKAYESVKSKVKTWFDMAESKKAGKVKETQHENFES